MYIGGAIKGRSPAIAKARAGVGGKVRSPREDASSGDGGGGGGRVGVSGAGTAGGVVASGAGITNGSCDADVVVICPKLTVLLKTSVTA